jgi:Fur family transcriptional regulator, zinc uptake regulator
MGKIDKKLAGLEKYCTEHGHRLTPPRLHVYEIIAASSQPLSAYDVLAKLKSKLRAPKPPTAYRALEFLSAHGFIHRIESLNAYVACGEDHQHNGSQFMICTSCGQVQEAHLCHVPPGLQSQADTNGFSIKRWSAELHGLCKACSA